MGDKRKPTLDELVAGIKEKHEEIDWGVVHKFEPKDIGEQFRFNPDEVLEAAKGRDFPLLAIIAQNPDGSIYLGGNANAGVTLILMERAKHQICFGDED